MKRLRRGSASLHQHPVVPNVTVFGRNWSCLLRPAESSTHSTTVSATGTTTSHLTREGEGKQAKGKRQGGMAC